MSNRRKNVIDFLKSNIMSELRDIYDLAEQSHLKLCECIDIDAQNHTDELANLELTRMHIEHIKEILGFYS